MNPFAIFVIVLIVIWTLSGIASAGNKKKELERRRRIADEMARMGQVQGAGQSRPVARPVARQAAPRQIAQGLAGQFPNVLPPRSGTARRSGQVRRPVPARSSLQQIVRHIAQPFTPIRPTTISAPAPVTPVAQVAQPAPVTPVIRPAAAPLSADASALSRWLRPTTMRQQFILTEVLQGPLALREQQPGDLP